MFLLKKIISLFFMPLSLCLGLLLLGLILIWFTKRQKAGKILVSIGTLMLWLLSCGVVPNTLIGYLEQQYPALVPSAISKRVSDEDLAPAKWVVVLCGGNLSEPAIPIISQLTSTSTRRLMEAIRLHEMLPGTKLLLAGGPVFNRTADSEVMAKAALLLGVRQKDIALISDANDTISQARRIKSVVGSDRHILVTSAYHMPRSMAMFRNMGMRPVPAPTDYYTKQRKRPWPRTFFPGAKGLYKAQIAFHEYLGLIWARLRNQI